MAATGAFNTVYIARAIIVPNDAAATARNIAASEPMYRVSILSGAVWSVTLLLLAAKLYRLLRDVGRTQARVMLIFAVFTATLGAANLLNEIAPLVILNADHFSQLGAQRDALALGFLQLRNSGINLDSAFFGLWLIPFGMLIRRSGFVPRILGALLVAEGCAYVAGGLVFILFPAWMPVVSRAMMPFAAGELLVIIWLLAKGVTVPNEPAVG